MAAHLPKMGLAAASTEVRALRTVVMPACGANSRKRGREEGREGEREKQVPIGYGVRRGSGASRHGAGTRG